MQLSSSCSLKVSYLRALIRVLLLKHYLLPGSGPARLLRLCRESLPLLLFPWRPFLHRRRPQALLRLLPSPRRPQGRLSPSQPAATARAGEAAHCSEAASGQGSGSRDSGSCHSCLDASVSRSSPGERAAQPPEDRQQSVEPDRSCCCICCLTAGRNRHQGGRRLCWGPGRGRQRRIRLRNSRCRNSRGQWGGDGSCSGCCSSSRGQCRPQAPTSAHWRAGEGALRCTRG